MKLGYEYKIEYSNGYWYCWRFDIKKRLDARAKLLEIEQISEWIKLQEGEDRYPRKEQQQVYSCSY